MTKYYAAVFPQKEHWQIPINTSTKKVIAWKTKEIPSEISKSWRKEWGIAELTKPQWTSLLFIDFSVEKLMSDMKKVDSVWQNINVIRKGKLWGVKDNCWVLNTPPSEPLDLT